MSWKPAAVQFWTKVLRRLHVPDPYFSSLHIVSYAKSPPMARSMFYSGLIGRRVKHEPLQYVLGTQPFYTSVFTVKRPVFIPRPETEHLCGLLIDRLKGKKVRILEVGCGSGAIAVTLCK